MTDRELAEVLGTHVALSSPLAAAWHRVAHGELPPEEAAERLESPEERENASTVFAPLEPEQQDAALAALLERLEHEASTSPSVGDDVVISRAWWRTPSWAVAVLAVAAAVLLVIFMPRPPSQTLAFSGEYTLRGLVGNSADRGDEGPSGEIPTYVLNGQLSAVLSPENEIEGPVGAIVFARNEDGETMLLKLEAEVESDGVVAIDAVVHDTGLFVGTWELAFAVGRADALPSSWDEIATAQARGDVVGYEVLRQSINVASRLKRP